MENNLCLKCETLPSTKKGSCSDGIARRPLKDFLQEDRERRYAERNLINKHNSNSFSITISTNSYKNGASYMENIFILAFYLFRNISYDISCFPSAYI